MAKLAYAPDLGKVTTVENVIYEQYSKNKDYRFRIIQRNQNVFQVITEKQYYDEDAPYYLEGHNGIHFADTFEKAIGIGIGMEELRCFSFEI